MTELFGRERVLVLIYEDYRRDNEATVRSVLRFLEVDENVPIRRAGVQRERRRAGAATARAAAQADDRRPPGLRAL